MPFDPNQPLGVCNTPNDHEFCVSVFACHPSLTGVRNAYTNHRADKRGFLCVQQNVFSVEGTTPEQVARSCIARARARDPSTIPVGAEIEVDINLDFYDSSQSPTFTIQFGRREMDESLTQEQITDEDERASAHLMAGYTSTTCGEY